MIKIKSKQKGPQRYWIDLVPISLSGRPTIQERLLLVVVTFISMILGGERKRNGSRLLDLSCKGLEPGGPERLRR